jgi:gliding motility-associated-like protein
LYIPNAFSPNGDNENDAIRLYFGDMTCLKVFSLNIFNRWGEKVFEATSPLVIWDGTYNGKPENAGVFMYYLKATLYNGEEVEKHGNINLIK